MKMRNKSLSVLLLLGLLPNSGLAGQQIRQRQALTESGAGQELSALFRLFRIYLEQRGYSADEIENEWNQALISFGASLGRASPKGKEDGSTGGLSILGLFVVGGGKRSEPTSDGGFSLFGIFRGGASSQEKLGKSGELSTEVTLPRAGVTRQFREWLTRNKDGKKNEFGRFVEEFDGEN